MSVTDTQLEQLQQRCADHTARQGSQLETLRSQAAPFAVAAGSTLQTGQAGIPSNGPAIDEQMQLMQQQVSAMERAREPADGVAVAASARMAHDLAYEVRNTLGKLTVPDHQHFRPVLDQLTDAIHRRDHAKLHGDDHAVESHERVAKRAEQTLTTMNNMRKGAGQRFLTVDDFPDIGVEDEKQLRASGIDPATDVQFKDIRRQSGKRSRADIRNEMNRRMQTT